MRVVGLLFRVNLSVGGFSLSSKYYMKNFTADLVDGSMFACWACCCLRRYATVSLKPINSGFGTRFLVEGSGVGVKG